MKIVKDQIATNSIKFQRFVGVQLRTLKEWVSFFWVYGGMTGSVEQTNRVNREANELKNN